jgi:cell division protein FtsX
VTRPWLVRRLVGDARRHRGVWLAVTVAFAVVGFCAAGARLVGFGARATAPAPPSHLVVSLKDDLAAPAVAELARVLAGLPGVEDVRPVSAREGLERLVRALGDRAPLLDGVGADLMFPTLELAVRPAAAADGLAFRLRRLRGVADVDLVSPAPLALDASGDGGAPTSLGARAAIGAAGAAALLALAAALALLRARLRPELSVLLGLGVTRATGARPALVLATATAALGAAAGVLGASGMGHAWLGMDGLAARDGAIGIAALAVLALLASRVALAGVEAAGAG